jgi:hypothetical protein
VLSGRVVRHSSIEILRFGVCSKQPVSEETRFADRKEVGFIPDRVAWRVPGAVVGIGYSGHVPRTAGLRRGDAHVEKRREQDQDATQATNGQ